VFGFEWRARANEGMTEVNGVVTGLQTMIGISEERSVAATFWENSGCRSSMIRTGVGCSRSHAEGSLTVSDVGVFS
jgi:hypothetical protein